MVLNGCLLFTWANRSVHGLGKWQAKFRAGKFHPGIAFTICTNQFHTPQNGLYMVNNQCACVCVFPGGLLFVSDQNDRQTESLSGQMVVILGGPLTGRYFKP